MELRFRKFLQKTYYNLIWDIVFYKDGHTYSPIERANNYLRFLIGFQSLIKEKVYSAQTIILYLKLELVFSSTLGICLDLNPSRLKEILSFIKEVYKNEIEMTNQERKTLYSLLNDIEQKICSDTKST